MKKISVLFMALAFQVIMHAQQINYAEYFIDSDPGYGMAIPISITATGADISLEFHADLALIPEGIHFLSIRARDDLGRWSIADNRVFYLAGSLSEEEGKISRAEYFVDADPGFGMALPVPIESPGNDLSLRFTAVIQSLDPGIHIIHFRTMDQSGRWGTVAHGVFFVVKIPPSTGSNINQVEYFIDTDPGYGNGTQVTLPLAGNDLEIDFNIPLTGLASGNHVLYVRAKNEQNGWGQVFAEGFSCHATGMDQVKIDPLFKIYPNPGNGELKIEINDPLQSAFRISLTDINGRLVYENECDGNPCEISLKVTGGTYLLTIETEENRLTQKIIIE